MSSILEQIKSRSRTERKLASLKTRSKERQKRFKNKTLFLLREKKGNYQLHALAQIPKGDPVLSNFRLMFRARSFKFTLVRR